MATLAEWEDRDKKAQERYLKFMQGKQALVDREYRKAQAEEAKAKADQEAMQPGEYAVKGAELGLMAGGPWGALVGGLAGKGLGSYEAAQRAGGSWTHKLGAGIGNFLSPAPEARYLATGAGMQHGANVAGGLRQGYDKSQGRKAAAARQEGRLATGPTESASDYQALWEEEERRKKKKDANDDSFEV